MSKQLLVQIVVTSILASIGTNLITGATGFNNFTKLFIGTVIIIIVVIIIYKQSFKGFSKTKKYKGFYIFDKVEGEIIDVNRYDFSFYIKHFMDSATYEIERSKTTSDKSNKNSIRIDYKDPRIIRDLLEYYLLDKLKVSTIDYFNKKSFESKKIEEISRNDMLKVVSENIFLNLFSKPIEERPTFNTVENYELESPNCRVITCFSDGGAMYDEFSLVLPVGSIVSRNKDGDIEIKTKNLIITFNFGFDERGGILPEGFKKYYLSKKNLDVDVNEVYIGINIEFKSKLIMFERDLEYYYWIDSFLEYLDLNFSSDRFFEKIGWDNAATVIEMLEKYNRDE